MNSKLYKLCFILIILLFPRISEAYISLGEKAEYTLTYYILIENQGPEAINSLEIL